MPPLGARRAAEAPSARDLPAHHRPTRDGHSRRLAAVDRGVPGPGTGIGMAAALLATVAVLMAVVASLTALGPARRILRIQAIEALRVDG